jgi:hypothetical protein
LLPGSRAGLPLQALDNHWPNGGGSHPAGNITRFVPAHAIGHNIQTGGVINPNKIIILLVNPTDITFVRGHNGHSFVNLNGGTEKR